MNIIKTSKHVISIPFIWMPLFGGLLIHLSIFIYQAVGFRLYGLERVKFIDFVCFDREKLRYLGLIDKVNCAYCSYMNGVFGYISEIAHRTEYYWCGIKHKNQPDNPAFSYQSKFAKYGNQSEYDEIMSKSGRRV
jgi:hypothetical protein